MSGDAAERDLEQALIDKIADTLCKLASRFACVGRQVHFEVGGDGFSLDLFFVHVAQLRYIVIELKAGDFQPGYAAKLGFYVTLVDDRLKFDTHAPTVGILVCGHRNNSTARFALGRQASSKAVATHTYDGLPATAKKALPPAEQLLAALNGPCRSTRRRHMVGPFE